MAELADRVLLSRSGMTRLVDRAGARGLLERDTCASDGRGCFAVLTEKGGAARQARARRTRRRARALPAALLRRTSWRDGRLVGPRRAGRRGEESQRRLTGRGGAVGAPPREPFEIRTRDPARAPARARSQLAHGEVRTPAFVPLATKGVVKTLEAPRGRRRWATTWCSATRSTCS